MFNSYQPNYFSSQPQMPQINSAYSPRTEVIRVNGRNGAEAYNMGPNSSALLLDESGTLVWLVTTDGAGYKSVAPYDITPHKAPEGPNFASLEARISKLEEVINGNSSDSTSLKQKRNKPATDAD